MSSYPASRTSYMAHRDGETPSTDDPLLQFAPVPHKAPRRNSIGPERQRAFVAHLAATGIVKQAARHIGASLEALYKLRHRPGAEEFAAAWDAAVDRGVQRLEDCALARAIEGEERLVVSGGQVLGSETRYNDNLVMFFLRNRRPDRHGGIREQDLKPGHPVYERIRREIAAEQSMSAGEVLASIDAVIAQMRERREANTRVIAETGGDECGEAAGGEETTHPASNLS
jgi:hypothetical protein